MSEDYTTEPRTVIAADDYVFLPELGVPVFVEHAPEPVFDTDAHWLRVVLPTGRRTAVRATRRTYRIWSPGFVPEEFSKGALEARQAEIEQQIAKLGERSMVLQSLQVAERIQTQK